jgi:hypothetical protein
VRETFEVAASLRLPRRVSKDEKKGIVDAIITELGLQKAANTRIGEGAGMQTGTITTQASQGLSRSGRSALSAVH